MSGLVDLHIGVTQCAKEAIEQKEAYPEILVHQTPVIDHLVVCVMSATRR